VSGPLSSSARLAAGAAVLLGLLGAALATLALVDAPAGPAAAGRAGPGAGPAHRSRAGSASSPLGLRLLSEAAAASVAISYEGVQIVAWWGPGGASTSVVQVWHERDRSILAQVTDMGSAPSAAAPHPTAGGAQDPDGVLALSRQLLILIRANYRVVDAGRGWADNRSARIVDLQRPDGSLAARFWLDDATKLPLRRETFDSGAHIVSEDAFINLRIGDSGRARLVSSAGLGSDHQPLRARLAAAKGATRQSAARGGASDRHVGRSGYRPGLLRWAVRGVGLPAARAAAGRAARMAGARAAWPYRLFHRP